MKKLKKLKKIERELGNDCCWRSENGQFLCVMSCIVGKNVFGWGENKPKTIDFSLRPDLKDDPRIRIITCENCNCCGDW